MANDRDEQPLLPEAGDDEEAPKNRLNRPNSRISRQSKSFRGLNSSISRSSAYYAESPDPSVAFTVVIKKDGSGNLDEDTEKEEALVDVTHHAVTGAVQDAVQEAVQDALQQALDENVRFDVRANFFTLIAITGVILFWRGIWSLW